MGERPRADRLPEGPEKGPRDRPIGFRRNPIPELFPLLHRHTGVNRIVMLLLATVLAGCGAQAAGPGVGGTVSGTSGPFHAEATPPRLAACQTVLLILTVTGAIAYGICF